MKGKFVALATGGLLILGSGCASDRQARRYEHSAPPQVVVPGPAAGAVVVPTPRRDTAIPAITENEAAEIARAEAYRHGWRNVQVTEARFWRDQWHVDIVHRPDGRRERQGWVDVAPDGSILTFAEGRHQHAGSRRRR